MATKRWSPKPGDGDLVAGWSPILVRDLARRLFVAMSDCFWRGEVVTRSSPHGI